MRRPHKLLPPKPLVWGFAAILFLLVILCSVRGRLENGPLPEHAENTDGGGVPPGTASIATRSAGLPAMQGRVRNGERNSGAPTNQDGAVDVCGFGKVAVDADDYSAAGRYIGDLMSGVRDDWLDALLKSDDVKARSAGLFLKSDLSSRNPGLALEDQDRDELVKLAVESRDPASYAMAVYACSVYSDPTPSGSCQRITLSTWAELDSDNAVPWLLLAGRAQADGDDTAAAGAFDHAVNADRADAYNFSLYAYAEPEMPSDATPLARWYLANQVIGVESATGSCI